MAWGERRALVIGFNSYLNGDNLTQCVEDAQKMRDMLEEHAGGDRNWTVDLLTDVELAQATKTRPEGSSQAHHVLRDKVARLFDSARDRDVLLYFAGHAAARPWGEELLAPSLHGIAFNDLLALVNASDARSVTLLLDCCYSGSFGDLATPAARRASYEQDLMILRHNVAVLTASRKKELSVDGTFTALLHGGLDGAAANLMGDVTTLSLFTHVAQAADAGDQQPILKAHALRPTVLRKVPPMVTRQQFMMLAAVFKRPNSKCFLVPEHEGKDDLEPKPPGWKSRTARDWRIGDGSEMQVQFDHLKLWRDAGLVASDLGLDFYWTMEAGGSVSLTPLGKYYLSLVQRGKI